MLRTGLTALALTLAGTLAAPAQPALDGIVSTLTRQGFSGFEVDREDGEVKLEARRNGIERELVWDAQTGQLLKDEIGADDDRFRGGDDGRLGARRVSLDDDAGDDRRGRGRGADDDDDDDDHGGRSGRGRGRGSDDGGRDDGRGQAHGSGHDGSGRGGDDDHDDD